MNVLFINLLRFGDLLQSQVSINEYALRGHKVALVCLDFFEEASELLSGLSLSTSLAGGELLALLNAKEKSNPSMEETTWFKALLPLYRWRDRLVQEFPVDLVCNVTPTLTASLLCRFLFPNTPVLGFSVDEKGHLQQGNPWGSLLLQTGSDRRVIPYNLVDIFRSMVASNVPEGEERGAVPSAAGGAAVASAAVHGASSASGCLAKPTQLSKALVVNKLKAIEERLRRHLLLRLEKEKPREAKGFFALQLGASNPIRQWPVAFFAELGEKIWKEYKLCPILLGSKAEASLGESYQSLSSSPSINLIGQTNLHELQSVFSFVTFFVTNDTGSMHLAAGVGCQIFAIFLATAQVFDTGPYCEGAISFEPACDCHPCAHGTSCPHNLRCHSLVSPEIVKKFIDAFIKKKQPEYEKSSARVWKSRLHENAFMFVDSLSGHEDEDRSLWKKLQFSYLSTLLNANLEAPSITFEPVLFSEQVKSALLSDLETALLLCTLLQEQIVLLRRFSDKKFLTRFVESWARMYSHLEKSEYLQSISALWAEEGKEKLGSWEDLHSLVTMYETYFSSLQKSIA